MHAKSIGKRCSAILSPKDGQHLVVKDFLVEVLHNIVRPFFTVHLGTTES